MSESGFERIVPAEYYEQKVETYFGDLEEGLLRLRRAEDYVDQFYMDKLEAIEGCGRYKEVSFNVSRVSFRVEDLRHVVTNTFLLGKAVTGELARLQFFYHSSTAQQEKLVARGLSPSEAFGPNLPDRRLTQQQIDFSKSFEFRLSDRQARGAFVNQCTKLCESDVPTVFPSYPLQVSAIGKYPRPSDSLLGDFATKYPIRPCLSLNIALLHLFDLVRKFGNAAVCLETYARDLAGGHIPVTPGVAMGRSKDQKERIKKAKKAAEEAQKKLDALANANVSDGTTTDEGTDPDDQSKTVVEPSKLKKDKEGNFLITMATFKTLRPQDFKQLAHKAVVTEFLRESSSSQPDCGFMFDENGKRYYLSSFDKQKMYIDDEIDDPETTLLSLPTSKTEIFAKLDTGLIPMFEAHAYMVESQKKAEAKFNELVGKYKTQEEWPTGEQDLGAELQEIYKAQVATGSPDNIRKVAGVVINSLQRWKDNPSDVDNVEKYYSSKRKLMSILSEMPVALNTMARLSVYEGNQDAKQKGIDLGNRVLVAINQVMIKFPELGAVPPGAKPSKVHLLKTNEDKLRMKVEAEVDKHSRKMAAKEEQVKARGLKRKSNKLPECVGELVVSLLQEEAVDSPTLTSTPKPSRTSQRSGLEKLDDSDGDDDGTPPPPPGRGRASGGAGGAGGGGGRPPRKTDTPDDADTEDDKKKKKKKKKKKAKEEKKRAKKEEAEKSKGRQEALARARRLRHHPGGDPGDEPSSSDSTSSSSTSTTDSSTDVADARGLTKKGSKKLRDKMKNDKEEPYMKYNFVKAGIPLESDPFETVSELEGKQKTYVPPEHQRDWERHTRKQRKELQVRRLEEVERRRQREDLLTQDQIMQMVNNLRKMGLSNEEINERCANAISMKAALTAPLRQEPHYYGSEPFPHSGKEIKPCAALPEFEGMDGSLAVKTFLKAADQLKRSRGWGEAYAAEMVRLRMIGKARTWLQNNASKNWTLNYSQLREKMIDRFYTPVLMSEKIQVQRGLQFDHRKHQDHMDFYDDIVSKEDILFDEGQLEIDWTATHTLEQCKHNQFLNIFLLGAAPNVRQKVLEARCTSLDACLDVARTFETALRSKDFRDKKRPGAAYEIHEVNQGAAGKTLSQEYGYVEEWDEEVMAVKDVSNILCYYCGETGHFKRNCSKLNSDMAQGNVGPDKVGKFAGEPPRQAAAVAGSPRRMMSRRGGWVSRRGRGAPTYRRGWRPAGPGGARGPARRRFVRGRGRPGRPAVNEVGREDTMYLQEQEESYYEPDGYYGEEEYVWAEEDEDGNVYYYYPEEQEPEEFPSRPDPEARGVGAKSSDAPAVGSVGVVHNSTSTQEGEKQQPRLFHLL